jgi:hypothetical protein
LIENDAQIELKQSQNQSIIDFLRFSGHFAALPEIQGISVHADPNCVFYGIHL